MAHAKFLHTADLHLSRPFGFLPPQLAEERRRDQRRVLNAIADLAIERDVDIILIAGDLFDTSDPDPTDLEAVFKEFSRLAESGKRIYAIPGNHDYAHPGSFWTQMHYKELNVFLEPEWNTVTDDLGIAVSGIAFNRANSKSRAFNEFNAPLDTPVIALVHGSYEAFGGLIQEYHPFSLSDLEQTKASYIALGHYHRLNQINAGAVTACYPGTPEGISFEPQEVEERSVIIGEINEDGKVSIEPVKINKRTMKSVELDCTSFQSEASLLDAIRKHCGQDILLELKLQGSAAQDISAMLGQLPLRFRESCLHLTIDTSGLSPLFNIPDDDRTIRGRFCKYLLQRIDDTSDPERRRLLQRALELGIASFDVE